MILALGNQQGEKHGGKRIIKPKEFGIGQEISRYGPYKRAENPSAVRREVDGINRR